MTKQELLDIYDELVLCAEQGKYGDTKETVRNWLEWAVDAYGIEKYTEGVEEGIKEEGIIYRNI